MSDYAARVGEARPPFAFQVLDPSGSPPDLTGATVTVKVVAPSGASQSFPATLTAPTTGRAQVDFGTALNEVGLWRAQVTVLFSDGKPQTLPSPPQEHYVLEIGGKF